MRGEGDADADAEETALIRRWLRTAEEIMKRSGGKKGGEPEERGRPPGDVHPPEPPKT